MTQTPEPKPRNHAEEIDLVREWFDASKARREREELSRIEFELDCDDL